MGSVRAAFFWTIEQSVQPNACNVARLALIHIRWFADVAQLVRALDCGFRGRWFKSTRSYHQQVAQILEF